MKDHITGISVIQPTPVHGIYSLWFEAERPNGNRFQSSIPVRFDPKILETTHPMWTVEIDPQSNCHLNGSPSIRIRFSTDEDKECPREFHNTYNWNTQFVMMIPLEVPWDVECERWHRASTVHYDLNNRQLTSGQRAELFSELRSAGIIH